MRTSMDFNLGWRFGKLEAGRPDPALPFTGEEISLPHTWYADGDYYRGEALYQKGFSFSPEEGRRVFLRFDGVDNHCEAWLNGIFLGEHRGGYTAFALELTDALRQGENLLSVFVSNAKDDTISPLSGDFTIFGGIYRKVELLVTEKTCFDPLFFGTDGVLWRSRVEEGDGLVEVDAKLSGPATDGMRLRYTFSESGTVVAEGEGRPGEKIALRVSRPRLWNGRKAPVLYEARAELYKDEALLDAVHTRLGFRSFSVDAEKGFFLNGTHMKLHGVAKHQDTAEVFSATSQTHWRRDMELIGELGANTVRLSHYPHAQEVYDLCDEMGLVVWAEIPLLKLTLNDALLENVRQQLTEMIYQNLHHPSICFWGIQNEIAIFGEKPWMTERMRTLNDLAHELDPDRLTTSANLNSVLPESSLNRMTDIQAYNVYYGWYYGQMADHAAFLDEFHRVNPDVPLGISEYGVDCNAAYHSEQPRVNDYTEEFQCLYHETVYPYMKERDFVWGSYIWNMFDFVSAIRNAGGVRARNIKGLVTHDRQTKKDSFYYYKAQWSEVPFIHIAEKRFARRTGESMTVKVYSNLPELTLRCGELVLRAASDSGVFRFENVPLSGNGSVVAVSGGGCEDRAVFTRVAQPEESYIFVDRDPGLNVRNWFVDEAEEARLFPEDAYSLRNKMEDLVASPAAMAVIKKLTPALWTMMQDTILSFTLEQTIQHERPDIPEETIKKLNLELNQIPRK